MCGEKAEMAVVRVAVEDLKELIEVRDHLRKQVTELQLRCNELLEENRRLRDGT